MTIKESLALIKEEYDAIFDDVKDFVDKKLHASSFCDPHLNDLAIGAFQVHFIENANYYIHRTCTNLSQLNDKLKSSNLSEDSKNPIREELKKLIKAAKETKRVVSLIFRSIPIEHLSLLKIVDTLPLLK